MADAFARDPATGIPAAAADALAACLLVAIGSCIRGTLLFLVGLPITLAGFAVASRAMWRADSTRSVSWLPSTSLLLCTMAAVGLLSPSTPGAPWYEIARRAFFVLGFAAIWTLFNDDARWRPRAIGAVVVAATALHLATPLGVPDPAIDVWRWTQACIDALLRGVHPYSVLPRDVVNLEPSSPIYPYLPLTLIAYTPAFALAGDYRYLSAICVPVTVALARATARRLAVGRRFTDATTLAFLLHPRGVWLTVYGWTEPLLVACAAAFVYLAVRKPAGAGQAIAFFLLPALKQYVLAPVFLYLGMKPPRPRASIVVTAAGVAAASVLPFLIWGWQPTIDGIIFQMVGPAQPRLDSTSLVALVGATMGVYPSRGLSIVAQIVVAAIAYARLRHHGVAGLLLASALALYATFLAGWQAFVNYYYFVGAILLLASISFAQRAPAPAPPAPRLGRPSSSSSARK